MLIFEDYIKDNKDVFTAEVIAICSRLGIKNPNWLMAVMWIESKLNHRAENTRYLVRGYPATGLIQFVVTTAGELLNSSYDWKRDKLSSYAEGARALAKIKALTNVQQLYYVEKYLKRYKGKLNSFGDLYLAVFYPAFTGRADSVKFPSSVRNSNPYIDLDKNGILTVGEFREWALTRIPQSLRHMLSDFFFQTIKVSKENLKNGLMVVTLFGVAMAIYVNVTD